MATGLALQGLGLVSVSTNLITKAKPTFGQRLAIPMKKKPSTESAWGTDLGASSLKAVRLEKPAKDNAVNLIQCEVVEYETSLRANMESEEVRDILYHGLAQLRDKISTDNTRICVGLPGDLVLFRQFELPVTDPKRLSTAVEFETKHQIPFPLEELAWDFYFLRKALTTKQAKKKNEKSDINRVVVLGAKKLHVQERLEVFAKAGIKIDILQSDFAALHNLACFEFLDDAEVAAFIDVGYRSSSFVVSTLDSLWSRTVNVGTDIIARRMSKDHNVTRADADAIVRAPHRIETPKSI